ncbi:MAG: tetratricopeptide repeat protein, partial [Gammaproteobacteria bacterium]|nr:tetratricopeptide repeat protein [Gammaproteobacteria bacterium]
MTISSGDPAAVAMSQAVQQAAMAWTRGEWAKAERLCRQVLAARKDHGDALSLLGIIAAQTGRTAEAADLLGRVVAAKPGEAAAHSDYGVVLSELKRFEEALESYARALRIKPDDAVAHNNRGVTLQELNRLDEALNSYARALQIRPAYAEAHYNRGNALRELKRFAEALDSYARALQVRPAYAEAYRNRGNTLGELNRLEEALDSYACALQINPDCDWVLGMWLYVKMRLCDWSDLDARISDLAARIQQARKITLPFPLLGLTDRLSLQRQAAETWVREKYPAAPPVPPLGKRSRRARLRVGYYSADYHNHATTYLMAELFERHDQRRFELLAFSYGPDKRDDMRTRAAAAFAQFLDVRTKSDIDIARLSRELEIDIAVDLK